MIIDPLEAEGVNNTPIRSVGELILFQNVPKNTFFTLCNEPKDKSLKLTETNVFKKMILM